LRFVAKVVVVRVREIQERGVVKWVKLVVVLQKVAEEVEEDAVVVEE
jgi:hypothetical protein